MLNVADIITDLDMAQSYTINRSSGSFGLATATSGSWQETFSTVAGYGPIYPSTNKELQQVPEGDIVTAAMTFLNTQPLYTTRNGQYKGTSDQLVWQGESYRVIALLLYQDYGYYGAIATRMAGD